MSTDDLLGIDYAWLAVDESGHVGVFTSAGTGPIPRWFAEDRAWLDAVFDVVDSLPARGTFRLEVPDLSAAPGLRDWKRWAELGLFAYDWLDVHRPMVAESRRYELIATPMNPIEAHAMPAALRERPVLSGVRFAKMRHVDVAPFV